MLKDKVNVRNRHQDALFAKAFARLLRDLHTALFRPVDNDLKAARIDELLNVLETVNVAARTDLDLHIPVDIFDHMDIFLMLLVVIRQVKNQNLVDPAVIVEPRQLNHIVHRGKIVHPPDRLPVFQIDRRHDIFMFHFLIPFSKGFPWSTARRRCAHREKPLPRAPLQKP